MVLKITVPAGMLVSASRWVVLMRTQAWDVVEKVEESECSDEVAVCALPAVLEKVEESERSDEVAVCALPAVLEKLEESDFEENWAEIALWAELAVWAEVA